MSETVLRAYLARVTAVAHVKLLLKYLCSYKCFLTYSCIYEYVLRIGSIGIHPLQTVYKLLCINTSPDSVRVVVYKYLSRQYTSSCV